MTLRVKLRIKAGGREVLTSALINTGYEADVPSILLPKKLAEALGFYPPATADVVTALTVGGEAFLLRSSEPVEVSVVTVDKAGAA